MVYFEEAMDGMIDRGFAVGLRMMGFEDGMKMFVGENEAP